MDALETTIKMQCAEAPRWLQIEIQAFWYGLISWSITCAEDNIDPSINTITIQNLLVHADKEFETWPTIYFESMPKEFIDLKLSLEEQNIFYEKLVNIFQDCIPVDINIFTLLSNGEELSSEQWERLYNAIAFMEPTQLRVAQKTRRFHGRRGITPMRNKKTFTRHKIIIKKEI